MSTILTIPTKILLNIKLINSQIANAPIDLRLSFFQRINFNFSDLIIANSKAGLNSYKIVSKNSRVIYNGYDFNRSNNLPDKEYVKKELGIETKFIVGMIASFSKTKDYKTYISSGIKILKERNDVTFICVGAGDFSIYKKTVSAEFRNKMKFIGTQNNIESIIQICDIGVLSTFSEGFPNSVLEFMAQKKPVVVSGEGGTKELVQNEVNGYIIPSLNIKALKDKILLLIDNSGLRETLGINAYNVVFQDFNLSNMVASYIKQYSELLSEKCNSRRQLSKGSICK